MNRGRVRGHVMRSRLLWKFLGIIVLVIGVVVVVVWLAIDLLASQAFVLLMERYGVKSPDIHQMFLRVAHWYLMWASFFGMAVGVGLGSLLTMKVLRPLSQMMSVTKKIAHGDYTTRVNISSQDEIGQLAASFNRMADSLQKTEQLRKTMVVDIAHELRSPLTNMRGYLEALKDGVLPPSSNTIELLHEETLRLARLAEDLLQLTEADAAIANLHLQKVHLRDVISQNLNLFNAQFAAKEISVETEFEGRVDGVMADPHKLAQVMHNLLQNAWQYTPRGGKVRVTAEQPPGLVRVTFANTGDGIAEKDLPFIFERFYRSEKSRSREHGGAGIGLAIVKELVEAHGGQVGAESAPDETRISFTLPV